MGQSRVDLSQLAFRCWWSIFPALASIRSGADDEYEGASRSSPCRAAGTPAVAGLAGARFARRALEGALAIECLGYRNPKRLPGHYSACACRGRFVPWITLPVRVMGEEFLPAGTHLCGSRFGRERACQHSETAPADRPDGVSARNRGGILDRRVNSLDGNLARQCYSGD